MTDEQEKLFDAFEKVFKFLDQHSGQSLEGDVPQELEKQLAALESKVGALKNDLSKTDEDNLAEVIPKLSEREQRLISQWSGLGMSTIIMAEVLERADTLIRERKKGKVGLNTKKSIQNRMNKFKNLGSDGKWKKL